MNIKEKIYYILKLIEDLSVIVLKGKPIKIHQMDLFAAIPENTSFFEIKQILLKLKEEEVVKIIQIATDMDKVQSQDGYYGGEEYYFLFKKYENFNNYYNNLKNELHPEKNIPNDDEIVYEVTYNEKDRRIFINNFLVAKLDFDSVNERVFSYLYKNDNKKISKIALEKLWKEEITKSFHSIVRDLGFTGKFKNVFFDVSEKTILFRKKIIYQDLKDLNISFIRIQEKKT